MAEAHVNEKSNWLERFASDVSADTRPGYQGYLVKASRLIEVVHYLKEQMGYDYLSSVTATDYCPEDRMEVVYHLYRSLGGPALELKVQLERANPTVPSLTGIFPGAELQEREVWDLLGIRFAKHPDLRRILLWEGFAGHPLRKDWREPFYEEDAKPFKSRWPEGHAVRAETRNPYGDNVQYPIGFDPDQWVPSSETALYETLQPRDGQSLKTDQMIVNLGPQHPSTHGVFRMVVVLEGETIVDLKPVMGYLHRNHEKIAERNTFLQNMPFTDRLDYTTSMANNFGYALAVEKLMGVQVPERAEYLRVMMAELTRVMTHMFGIGFLLNDLGAYFTPSLYAIGGGFR